MTDTRNEFAQIARWETALPTRGEGVLRAGGDDAAWLCLPGVTTWTTDAAVEGVHFRRDWLQPEEIGYRCIMAALSDLAASRSLPTAALLTMCVPSADLAEGSFLDRVVDGLASAAKEARCLVVGGDTTRTPGPLMLSISALGRAQGDAPLGRDGARPGDLLQLSGPTGLAALAIADLLADRLPDPACRAAYARPRARFDLVPSLAGASAGIDVSDGLLADAAHIARASGVRLTVDTERVLALLQPPTRGRPGARDAALGGGDDYEILATAAEPLPGFTVIGRVDVGAGLWDLDGTALPPLGWDHGCSP